MSKFIIETLNYYNKNAKDFVTDTIDATFAEIQDRFLSYIPVHGMILDFGCGSGRDAKCFYDLGYSVKAVDGSAELCRIASAYTGLHVEQMMFQELNDTNEYDGIWACASILHLNRHTLKDVICRMECAVKNTGVMYVSFKYGDFEGMRNNRYFIDFTEQNFAEFIRDIPSLVIEQSWISSDVREGRGDEKWLNVILKKQISQ